MQTATSTPVYTSSKEANGHVVAFDVSMRNFQTTRIFDASRRGFQVTRVAIRLPEVCKLYDDSFDPDLMVEAMFYRGEGNTLMTTRGIPNTELLAAADVLVGHMVDPFHRRIGLRASSRGEGTVLICYLSPDIEMQLLCEEVANAVYDKIGAVTYQHAWFGSMSSFEHRDWQDYQLIG